MEVRRSSGGLTALYAQEMYDRANVISMPSAFYVGRRVFVRRAVGDTRPLTPKDIRLITSSFIPEGRAGVIVNYSCRPAKRFLCAWVIDHLFANRPR